MSAFLKTGQGYGIQSGHLLFFGLQNYKSSSNKKNYQQKSNIPGFLRCLPVKFRSLPEMTGPDGHTGDNFEAL
jgi:hypothetical protein